jgi:hypothetical protein
MHGCGSGIEKLDLRSGINIPDTQHLLFLFFFSCCRIKPEDFQQERANSGCYVMACEKIVGILALVS